MNKKMLDFSSYDDFFGERIFPKFLLFSYIGLFLSIIYLPFDYSVYKDTPYLIGALTARSFAIFFAIMVVFASKLDYFSKKRVLAIAIFGTLGYSSLTFSYIAYNAPSFFIIINWFFYLVATMMLGALMTKKIFIYMESFQILIVLVLMVYFKKSQEDLFLYFIVASSLIIYVYAVISLNRKNGEEFYKNAYYMYVTSSLDGLSGLLNRRSWYEKAQKIYELKDNVSFFMLDIDFFKKINDNYGHDTGDVVIKKISDILLEQTREQDIVGRLGGEEFGVLLVNSQLEEVINIAQRIRTTVEKEIISHNSNTINVTVSIGISMKNENLKDFKEFIKSADLNLYKAKESGRNKVIY
jgi:diguanylate cyclase (GGDEF)-like protein